jgi:MYXO-CTERM domain-containing protein
VRVLVWCLILGLPGPALAQGVFRGPLLQSPKPDEITLVYESPSPSTGVVRYGVGAPSGQTVNTGAAATHHELRLTGLSALGPPGTEIRYELEVGGTVHAGSFLLPPAAGSPFRFIVYGDNRSSPAQHQQVVNALMADTPRSSFAINTGDLVSSGQDEGDWDEFFPVANPFLAQTPLYMAIGNHETVINNWDVTRRIFVLPTDQAPASNEEGFYRVLYGNVELIVINVEADNLYTVSFLAGDQEAWLEQVLATRTAGIEHRFLFIHQGPYSSKVGRNGNFWLRQWLPDLATAGIDVIFSGHDHYGERGFAENGIPYVIHGGGGAPLYETLGPRTTSDHTIIWGESRLGYATVDIDGPKATIQLRGLAGEVLDQFSYGDAVAPACQQASDCGPAPTHGCPGGGWACEKNACRYACGPGSGSLIACATDRACEDLLTSCQGTPTCQHPSLNPLGWYCECVLPPECQAAADCAGRSSPIPGCTGTWGCEDEQCEFTAELCMPVDAGVDAGAADSGTQSPIDGGVDGAIADAGQLADAAAPADTGLSGEAPPAASGCGCETSSGAGPELWLWLSAALFYAGARRLNRSPRRPLWARVRP